MAFFKIGSTDFSSYVQGLKCDYETLLSENSGRNAAGDNVVDIVNRKWKLNLTFKPLNDTQMSSLLNAISTYVVSVTFLNPMTKATTTKQFYTSTPSPEYYTIQNGNILFKPLQINFIEM